MTRKFNCSDCRKSTTITTQDDVVITTCQDDETWENCLGVNPDGRPDNFEPRTDVCTCHFDGPRPHDQENGIIEVCPFCQAFHKRFFPAFPGDPAWRLNHGAIDRNSWGIRPSAIPTRNIEVVSSFQIQAAIQASFEARRNLEDLLALAAVEIEEGR